VQDIHCPDNDEWVAPPSAGANGLGGNLLTMDSQYNFRLEHTRTHHRTRTLRQKT